MTQKRGLGRGLGALIPGAGAAPAPEQPLRTRTHPRTEPEAGEKGASARPVDMFFSGEPSESEQERPQRSGASRRDLANDMARAAAERRGRGSATRRTKSSAEGEAATAEKASAKSASAKKEPGSKTESAAKAEPASKAKAAPTKTTPTKTKAASTKATPASKASPSKAASASKASSAKTEAGAEAKAAPATSTDAAASSEKDAESAKRADDRASAKDTGEKAGAKDADETAGAKDAGETAGASGSKASTRTDVPAKDEASTSAHAADEESPVVDIEAVELTPARADVSSGESEGHPEEGTTEARRAEQNSTEDDSDAAMENAAVGEATVDGAAEQDSAEAQQVEQEPEEIQEEQESPELLPVPGTEFAEIPIHEIRENPRNPRTMFDEDELDELAYSLREVGVLQPIVVRPIRVTDEGESFELVMGERRWRAARRAGLASIPAIIRETSDDDLLRDALLENLHRSQLNPLEEAAAYQQLLEDFGCTQDELAERIGRSRPQVSNTLRLMRLPALVQRRLASGAISAGHARALLALEDSSLMEELAQRIVAEGLSVRAVERLVSRGTQPAPSRTPRRSTYDPHVVDITSRLSKSLEAPVRIDVGKRKGRITLEFTNLEDLERLVERIGLEMPDSIGSQQD